MSRCFSTRVLQLTPSPLFILLTTSLLRVGSVIFRGHCADFLYVYNVLASSFAAGEKPIGDYIFPITLQDLLLPASTLAFREKAELDPFFGIR